MPRGQGFRANPRLQIVADAIAKSSFSAMILEIAIRSSVMQTLLETKISGTSADFTHRLACHDILIRGLNNVAQLGDTLDGTQLDCQVVEVVRITEAGLGLEFL